jgi:diphthamide synthase (EF-2-diphthine--ammonia ligase)
MYSFGHYFPNWVTANLEMSPFLEGGEGETSVADAPFFKKRCMIYI